MNETSKLILTVATIAIVAALGIVYASMLFDAWDSRRRAKLKQRFGHHPNPWGKNRVLLATARPITLLDRAQWIAPRMGWNAETDEKFVHRWGMAYRYDMSNDMWFFRDEASKVELPVDEDHVSDWLDSLEMDYGDMRTA